MHAARFDLNELDDEDRAEEGVREDEGILATPDVVDDGVSRREVDVSAGKGVASTRAGRFAELANKTVPGRLEVEGVGAEIAASP